LAPILTKVCSFYIDGQHPHTSTGTIFIPRDFQTDDISIWLNANATPSLLGPDALRAGLDQVMSLYPDDPSAGSPFGTGNQTFGTGPGYKRAAALCTSSIPCAGSVSVLTGYSESVGDIHFQAPRRFWSRTTDAPSYAYIFTDPQTNGDPAVGVTHGGELPYLFGNISTSGPPKVASLSRAMLDYWISFVVSLTPNDGQGTSSTLRYASMFCSFSEPYLQDLSGERTRKLRCGMSSPN
jgi:hypothetical protein